MNRMYQLSIETKQQNAYVANVNNQVKLWHQRLGHVHQASLKKMICKKKTRDPFPVGEIQTTEILQWYIVTSVDQCRQKALEEHATLSPSLTTIHDV